ncbi:MAG: adenylate/guanylate cyclase domain-containing protein [Acidimicrobiia bacterium]
MSDPREPDPALLERQNRSLEKKLARAERKLETLGILQEQNANLLRALMAELDEERSESERLLLNILPEPIAQRLKTEPGVIADRFDGASVLFADIVGFTPLSETLDAKQLVEWLNDVYSVFDALTQQRGVEKIRTIGDGYMAAAGVPFPRDDHASAIVRLALDMRDHFATLQPVDGHRVNFRIGIHSGPVVGGVIGTHKFQYDIWGDTVNTAARMESHGRAGRVHISTATHEIIRNSFVCEPRGSIEVKGKGQMETWFVESEVSR